MMETGLPYCQLCGSVVEDNEVHDEFHVGLENELNALHNHGGADEQPQEESFSSQELLNLVEEAILEGDPVTVGEGSFTIGEPAVRAVFERARQEITRWAE